MPARVAAGRGDRQAAGGRVVERAELHVEAPDKFIFDGKEAPSSKGGGAAFWPPTVDFKQPLAARAIDPERSALR